MRFLRKPEVKAKTGLGYTTIYDLVKANKFPKPVRLTDNCSAWVDSEVEEWQRSRVEKRDAALATKQK
jgi:prophage regulatory protein